MISVISGSENPELGKKCIEVLNELRMPIEISELKDLLDCPLK